MIGWELIDMRGRWTLACGQVVEVVQPFTRLGAPGPDRVRCRLVCNGEVRFYASALLAEARPVVAVTTTGAAR